MDALAVFVIALGTALATGLGVLPVMAARMNKGRSIALSSAIAGGFMLGASAGLFYEGATRSLPRTVAGAVVGVGFIMVTTTLLGRTEDAHVGNLRGARGMTAVLVIGVMTVHSFTEGVAIGVSFADGRSLGVLIGLAIAVHNIPEGVAIALALMPFGVSAGKAAAWSIFSSLPQPLMAVPAFLAVSTFEPLLPAGLGFAGGAMVWMVLTQLLPESMSAGNRPMASAALLSSLAVMIAFEVAIGL